MHESKDRGQEKEKAIGRTARWRIGQIAEEFNNRDNPTLIEGFDSFVSLSTRVRSTNSPALLLVGSFQFCFKSSSTKIIATCITGLAKKIDPEYFNLEEADKNVNTCAIPFNR